MRIRRAGRFDQVGTVHAAMTYVVCVMSEAGVRCVSIDPFSLALQLFMYLLVWVLAYRAYSSRLMIKRPLER